ncbi:hypothetical protein GCM10017783_14310 [Deinococcus piscis]|uniref:Uncharacterized protein n=2 Tax=Deinococcus piscis TaxID=394230 RepID=A0ABQ3K4U1_9DEIO|nr:hypothetical protein GCM10017783_14310 [Deinococcus piscis]
MCTSMYSETMQARKDQAQKDTLPWVIALVTLGAALGLAAAMYYDRSRSAGAGQDDSEAPLFI